MSERNEIFTSSGDGGRRERWCRELSGRKCGIIYSGGGGAGGAGSESGTLM